MIHSSVRISQKVHTVPAVSVTLQAPSSLDGSAYRELSWLIYLATLAFTNRSPVPLEILRGLYLEL